MEICFMKLSELRKKIKEILKDNDKDVKDADFILSEVLGVAVTNLFIDREINSIDEKKIMSFVKERIAGKPITKIFNKAYFYGLEFFVDENVLSPRPETELVVDTALSFIKDKHLKVLDLCTGSGAIACAIKKNSKASVSASDISNKALKVASINASELGLDINFIESDMFDNINNTFDVIVSNPPYIESGVCKTLDEEVFNHDPILALDGGLDGLDFYRTIKENLNHLKPNGVLIMEIGYNQSDSLKQIFEDYKTEILKDYNNLDRVVVVKIGGHND